MHLCNIDIILFLLCNIDIILLPGPSGIVPPTKRRFVSQFRACLSAIGISHVNRFEGHSFRRGAASWAFSCGV